MGNKSSKKTQLKSYYSLKQLNTNLYKTNIDSKNSKKIVKFDYNGKISCFTCDGEDLFSTQISKFKERNGIKDLNFIYIFNTETISPNLKLNQINNYNSNEFLFHAIEIENLRGSQLPIDFTDLSKQIYEEVYFSDNAPSYRAVSIGINIFGKCNGKDCIARKKNVIVPLGRTSQFDLINEKEKIIMPKMRIIYNSKNSWILLL